ncbi:unnamed protein product [Cuscuta campestris]|uniref:Uncharacterized protein n=1 Tax=Cuscuta campestris TaxID=132261 RepID=A0A484KMJ7_9ASTE|nr:unnamed protein product [Cuscuta campestris]
MDGFGFDAHTGNESSSETPVVNVSAGLGGLVGQTTPINIPFGSSAAMGSTPITTFVGSSVTMGSAQVTSVIGPTAATAAMVTPLGPNMASAIPVIPSLGPNTGVFTSAPVGHPIVMLPTNSVKEPEKFTGWLSRPVQQSCAETESKHHHLFVVAISFRRVATRTPSISLRLLSPGLPPHSPPHTFSVARRRRRTFSIRYP